MRASHTSQRAARCISSLRKFNDRAGHGVAREDVPARSVEAFDFSKHPQAMRKR